MLVPLDLSFLLRLDDVQQALVLLELPQVRSRDVSLGWFVR
jgi:hypothetical protein